MNPTGGAVNSRLAFIPMTAIPDICQRKHHKNPESREAFEATLSHLNERQAEVMAAVTAAGAEGVTCDELAAQWDRPQHTLSARFTELSAAGLIDRAPFRRHTRSGCMAAVWVVKPVQLELPL